MTDRSNIDEILKSIDALLKEGHEEQRRNDDVIDDAASANADADAPLTETSNATANQVEISILPDAVDDESEGETDRTETEAQTDTLAAESPGEEQQQNEQNEPAVPQDASISGKRILLSADMQVQDTPELPLAAVETEPLEASQTATEDVSPPAIDEAQVAQITADVCAALQRQLPEMIAPLVAAALRRHLLSDAADEHRQ